MPLRDHFLIVHDRKHRPRLLILPVRPTLFLDVDGVLNETATAKQIALDEDKVMLLRDVLERSDAEIVLTTYWRYFREYLAYAFVRHGLPDRVVGKTAGEPHRADSVAHDAAVSTNRVMAVSYTHLTLPTTPYV